jgi:hypothetical protein
MYCRIIVALLCQLLSPNFLVKAQQGRDVATHYICEAIKGRDDIKGVISVRVYDLEFRIHNV